MQRRHLLSAAAVLPVLAACGGGDDDEPNIVDRLKADADYSTLVAAVTAAGLATQLSGTGPFTVFAPTNAAFAAVLTELGISQQALLDNKTLLTAVLSTHVVAARVPAADVPNGKAVNVLGGGIVKPEKPASGGVTVQDGRNRVAKVTKADIFASNGVIHAIDKVLLPADKNIVQTAQANPAFSILVEAVLAADLAGALTAAGPLTVFAPTDAAFAALLTELNITKDALLADKALLTRVLTYHVVNGRVLKADVPVGADITTLQTGKFKVDATLTITDARSRTSKITTTDLLTTNGVIHVIDKVILPAAGN